MTNTARIMTATGVLWLCGGTLGAHVDPPAEPAKENAPAQSPQPQPKDDEPSLDELLGISPKTASKLALPDTTKTDLDKKLSAEQVGDLFESAVALMGEASKRLASAMDAAKAKAASDAAQGPEAWLQTQRVQEDVIRKLDAMIAELEKQGGGQSSRSRQKQQQQDPNQPQQQQQSSSSQKRQSKAGGDGQTDHDPPAGESGQLSPDLEAARAAWGSLPERVREMLQQGSGDKYSSLYERLTADYYKRLAEQGRTRGGSNGSGDRKP